MLYYSLYRTENAYCLFAKDECSGFGITLGQKMRISKEGEGLVGDPSSAF